MARASTAKSPGFSTYTTISAHLAHRAALLAAFLDERMKANPDGADYVIHISAAVAFFLLAQTANEMPKSLSLNPKNQGNPHSLETSELTGDAGITSRKQPRAPCGPWAASRRWVRRR